MSFFDSLQSNVGGLAGQISSQLSSTASTLANNAESQLSSIFGGSGGNGAPYNAQGQSMGAFVEPRYRPEYQVTILGYDADGVSRRVHGWISEGFSFDVQSNWSQPFADNLIGNTANIAGQLLGKRWTTQGLSSQFWTGSEPVSFGLALTFVAETGPQDLLGPIQNLYALTLPSTDGLGFFTAPGPKLKGGQSVLSAVQSLASNAGSAVGSLASKAFGSLTGQTSSISPPVNTGGVGGDTESGDSTSLLSTISKYFQYENLTSLTIGSFIHFKSIIVKSVGSNFKVEMSRDGVPISVTANVQFETHQTPSNQDVFNWLNVVPGNSTIGGLNLPVAVMDSVTQSFNTSSLINQVVGAPNLLVSAK